MTDQSNDSAIVEAIRRAVAVLNEARQLDPSAMREMLDKVVETNPAIAYHPTIQVYRPPAAETRYIMTPLGLINGILGCNERTGYVARVGSMFVHHRTDTGDNEEALAAGDDGNYA